MISVDERPVVVSLVLAAPGRSSPAPVSPSEGDAEHPHNYGIFLSLLF